MTRLSLDPDRLFPADPGTRAIARRLLPYGPVQRRYPAFLARLVAEGRLRDWEAQELAEDLTYNLVRKAYRLPNTLARTLAGAT